MAKVDVGLPIPLGNYSYLPPVQTGINDAVEEQAMNPLLAWLAGQGIDLAAEKTGVKDVLRERGAGILDMVIPQAQAAETAPMPPVQTGFQPTTSVVAQDATPAQRSAMNYVPDDQIPMEGRMLPTREQTLVRQDWEGPGRGLAQGDTLPDGTMPVNMDGVRELPPITQWAMADSTPPATDPEVDKAIKEAPKDSMLGRLWDSTLGNEEWRLRKAMILNSMRLNPDAALTTAFASRIKDLRDKKGIGRTAQWLRSQGYNKYADLVEQYPEMAKDVLKSIAASEVKSPSAAEEKIARIQEMGYSREQAIRISDLTSVMLDPDTKEPILVDKTTGKRIGPMTPRAGMEVAGAAPAAQAPTEAPSRFQQRALPEGVKIETPEQVLERADIPGSLGLPGYISEAVNLPFDIVGADRPLEEQATARSFMEQLTSRTMLALAGEFPGKPSDLARKEIKDLTVQAGEIAQGPQKALDKQTNLVRLIYQALESQKFIFESGQGFDATQRNAAREKYNQLVPLYDEHVALFNKLKETVGEKTKAGTPVISPDVGSLLEKYQ